MSIYIKVRDLIRAEASKHMYSAAEARAAIERSRGTGPGNVYWDIHQGDTFSYNIFLDVFSNIRRLDPEVFHCQSVTASTEAQLQLEKDKGEALLARDAAITERDQILTDNAAQTNRANLAEAAKADAEQERYAAWSIVNATQSKLDNALTWARGNASELTLAQQNAIDLVVDLFKTRRNATEGWGNVTVAIADNATQAQRAVAAERERDEARASANITKVELVNKLVIAERNASDLTAKLNEAIQNISYARSNFTLLNFTNAKLRLDLTAAKKSKKAAEAETITITEERDKAWAVGNVTKTQLDWAQENITAAHNWASGNATALAYAQQNATEAWGNFTEAKDTATRLQSELSDAQADNATQAQRAAAAEAEVRVAQSQIGDLKINLNAAWKVGNATKSKLAAALTWATGNKTAADDLQAQLNNKSEELKASQSALGESQAWALDNATELASTQCSAKELAIDLHKARENAADAWGNVTAINVTKIELEENLTASRGGLTLLGKELMESNQNATDGWGKFTEANDTVARLQSELGAAQADNATQAQRAVAAEAKASDLKIDLDAAWSIGNATQSKLDNALAWARDNATELASAKEKIAKVERERDSAIGSNKAKQTGAAGAWANVDNILKAEGSGAQAQKTQARLDALELRAKCQEQLEVLYKSFATMPESADFVQTQYRQYIQVVSAECAQQVSEGIKLFGGIDSNVSCNNLGHDGYSNKLDLYAHSACDLLGEHNGND